MADYRDGSSRRQFGRLQLCTEAGVRDHVAGDCAGIAHRFLDDLVLVHEASVTGPYFCEQRHGGRRESVGGAIRLAERGTWLGDRLWVREVRKLTESWPSNRSAFH
jgi:hypothetical protein